MMTQFNAARDRKPTLHLRIPSNPRFARTVRDAITGFAKLHGVANDDLESLLFAVGEALANAIEHAATASDIEVICEVDEREIVATVIDEGKGLAHAPSALAPLPDGLHERGRGIPIMQRCTDIFAVDTVPGGGTAVTLGLRRMQAN